MAPGSGRGFWRLLGVCRRLRFEPHTIARQFDERRRYEVELDREFPFLIKQLETCDQPKTFAPLGAAALSLHP